MCQLNETSFKFSLKLADVLKHVFLMMETCVCSARVCDTLKRCELMLQKFRRLWLLWTSHLGCELQAGALLLVEDGRVLYTWGGRTASPGRSGIVDVVKTRIVVRLRLVQMNSLAA